MPSIETTERNDDAVYWEATGKDRYGEETVAAEVDLKVRWENRKGEALDPDGNTIGIDATVVVNQDIVIGSSMWQGTIATLPTPQTNLMRVVTFNKTPDIKGRNYRRTVGLIRSNDTVPSDT